MPSCSQDDLAKFIERSPNYSSVFFKALAHNDHQWSRNRQAHQSGVLIPRDCLTFFGLNTPLPQTNHTIELDMTWFLNGREHTRAEIRKNEKTNLRYFCEGNRRARPESHLTRVYLPYFADLEDADILLIGRINEMPERYEAVIVGVRREGMMQLLLDGLGLPDPPSWGILQMEMLAETPPTDLMALLRKKAALLYEEWGGLPTTAATNQAVWQILQDHELDAARDFDPAVQEYRPGWLKRVVTGTPGDLVRWSLQKLEFALVRYIEELHYPPRIVDALRSDEGEAYPPDWEAMTRRIGRHLEPLMAVTKSMTQSRRSRAGKSFEHYIAHLLTNYQLEFEPQAGENRMDFHVQLPAGPVMLSAKTTARERWLQVPEGSWFITLDPAVSAESLETLIRRNVKLVVPEKDKRGIALYRNSPHVTDLRTLLKDLRHQNSVTHPDNPCS